MGVEKGHHFHPHFVAFRVRVAKTLQLGRLVLGKSRGHVVISCSEAPGSSQNEIEQILEASVGISVPLPSARRRLPESTHAPPQIYVDHV